MTTTITSKGQVTIPAGIRELIGLHEGDKLDFHIDADGQREILVTSWDQRFYILDGKTGQIIQRCSGINV